MPLQANDQLAFACYQVTTEGAPYRLNEINVLTLVDGRIAEMTALFDPAMRHRFGLPEELAEENYRAAR